MAGSEGNAMFSLLRNCQTVLQSGCIVLHHHKEIILNKDEHIHRTNGCACPLETSPPTAAAS